MKFNLGFFISKIIRFVNRPALRDCCIDKHAWVGTGSNCIKMTMGKYSYISKNCSIVNTRIGNFCSIASYCSIGGRGHILSSLSTSPVFYTGSNIFKKNLDECSIGEADFVTIGNDVWIGEKVFIKEGVVIGNGAVIGAHSVVTEDVPDYAVVAGVPARIIKYRFSENTISELLSSQWWNMSDIDIIKYNKDFKVKQKNE